MKRHISILFIIFSCSNLFGQDLPHFFSSEIGKSIITKYSVKKLKINRKYQRFIFRQKSQRSAEFEFDKQANVIREYCYFKDSIDNITIYKFDNKNNLTEKCFYCNTQTQQCDNFIFLNKNLIEENTFYGWHTLNKYNSLGTLLETFTFNDKIVRKNKGDSITYANRKTNFQNYYDKKNRLIKTIATGYVSYTIIYDTLGRCIQEDGIFVTNYYYNNLNQLIDIKITDKYNSNQNDTYKFYYNKQGNCIKKIYLQKDEFGKNIKKEFTNYRYNKNGLLKKIVIKKEKGNEYHIFTYDKLKW